MIHFIAIILEFLMVYFGWLSFFTLVLAIGLILKRYWVKTSSVLLFFSVLFIWAHYVEPQWIVVREQKISGLGLKADVILLSDLHLGLYKDQQYLQRIVDTINHLQGDYVLIAGDFLYKNTVPLQRLFAPLSRINKPVYAVRGNHDYHGYNQAVVGRLRDALRDNNVQIIEHKVIDFGDYQLAGLGDHHEGSDDGGFLRQRVSKKPLLVLAHNPDSVEQLTQTNARLLLAGHTHCGQVKVPFIYPLFIHINYSPYCGYSFDKTLSAPVFITPGIGEDNLPLRLFNPPTINVLRLRP